MAEVMCQDLIKGGTAMPTTSNRIKELRANLGKTIQEIAEKTGIKKSTIGSYETRGINPNAEKAQILADYFNVSVDYLLGNTDMPVRYNGVQDADLDWIIKTYIQANESEKEFIKSAIKLVGDRLNLNE